MSRDTARAVASLELKGEAKHGQWSTVLTLLAFVIGLDQLTKWWAWRNVSSAIINVGGDPLAGHTLGGWYTGPLSGALLDFLDFGLLGIALFALLRRQRPTVSLVSGALMIGGWASNLLDRLGMHFITAPGSVRGAVDFMHIGSYYYNLADFVIIGATVVFLLDAVYMWANAHVMTKAVTPATWHWARGRAVTGVAVAGAVGLVLVVALGAADDSGVDAPDPSISASVSQ